MEFEYRKSHGRMGSGPGSGPRLRVTVFPKAGRVQRVQAAAGLSPWAARFGPGPASPSGLVQRGGSAWRR